MSRAIAESDRKDRVIRGLTIFCIVLLGLLGHAHYLLGMYPDRLELHAAPSMQAGDQYSKDWMPHEIHSFAFLIWQKIARCEDDCSKEYEINIRNYGHYFTDQYRENLLAEAKLKESENRKRARSVSENGFYEESMVDQINNRTWVVNLEVREKESIGSREIRNAVVRYPIVVTRVDVDRQKNPFGLALAGLSGEPVRVE